MKYVFLSNEWITKFIYKNSSFLKKICSMIEGVYVILPEIRTKGLVKLQTSEVFPLFGLKT